MIVDLADLKEYLGVTGFDEDWRLSRWAEAASAYVHNHTRRYFGPVEEVIEVYRGLGRPSLWLLEPVVDGDAITVVERMYPDDTGRTIADDDVDGWTFRSPALLLRAAGAVWLREMEYTVTYSRGYALGSAPEDIRLAVMDMVQLKRASWARDGKTVASEKLGDYSYTLGDVMQAGRINGMDHRETLNMWRRVLPVTG